MAATVHPSATAVDSTTDLTAAEPVPTSPTARLTRSAAVVGPALMLASSVAWMAGDDAAELRGILQFWALPFLLLGLLGLVALLEGPAPRARAVVTALLAIGACAGASFAQEILMVEHFDVERLMGQETPSAMVALGLPGLMFPLSIVLTGLLSYVHRTQVPLRAGLLALGGFLFPVSRIPQVAGIAVLADAVLLVAMVPMLWPARTARTARTVDA